MTSTRVPIGPLLDILTEDAIAIVADPVGHTLSAIRKARAWLQLSDEEKAATVERLRRRAA